MVIHTTVHFECPGRRILYRGILCTFDWNSLGCFASGAAYRGEVAPISTRSGTLKGEKPPESARQLDEREQYTLTVHAEGLIDLIDNR